ncbi:hypothetical protein RclHR1_39410001 [Rhizophagus clarus]|uniref:Uncharacterized protein n=1 Tax=Rhizophagus clarus TaxID=94130 RepID=A0A2Z6S8M8_9GLOM|nr:hypothetical protein RclHR1_39410001 [Rhizophagus clarus]GES81567.1 hypothetical protein GLOIN_2v935947 [Rhizophagus clarus]
MSSHWSERLLIYNPYKCHLFKCRNRSIIVRDDTRKYEVLPLHAKIGIGENLATSGYLDIKVNGYEPEYEDRTWVPIIPGYTIFTKVHNSFVQLSIEKNIDNTLIFYWADYGGDETFANIQYSSRKPDFFASLIARLPGEGRISIPDLLGFNDKNNVEFLRSIINAKFPTIFKDFKKNYSAINKGITLKQSCKRKGIAILDDITLSSNSTSNIMSGLTVSREGLLMDGLSVQALAVQFFEIKDELYRVKKQLKIEKDKNLQNNHEEEDIDENQNLDYMIDEAISKE